MTLRGATASEAWVTMEPRDAKISDQAVVDLGSGCIVETLPPFTRLPELVASGASPFARGSGADKTKQAEAKMAEPAIRAELARFVATGQRFGRRRLGFGTFQDDDVAFSADGRTIAVETAEAVFRSRDGGSTFDRLDPNMSRFPAVTSDGKWILYERCADPGRWNQSCPAPSREVRVVASDDSVAPRRMKIGGGLVRGLDPTGQKLVVVRDDVAGEVTVMHVDPTAGTMARAFGIPAGPLGKNRFFDVDPSPATGTFGLFDDTEKHPTSAFTVVSMTDGHVVQRFSVQREMGTATDDEAGRLVWQTYYDDHAWARRPNGATRDLGMGDPLGWAPGGRVLVFAATYSGGRRLDDPPATLGAVACKLVRVTTVP
jgi:hypothetical protein